MAGQAKDVHYKIDRPRTFTLRDIDSYVSRQPILWLHREQADGV